MQEIVFETNSLDEFEAVALEIKAQFSEKVIAFKGEMGAGKTTMINALCKAFGVEDATSSPTFSLVNEYEGADGEILYHFDFYRLEDESEAFDMGYEDYFYSGNFCFIEWPEKVVNLLPDNLNVVEIKHNFEQRTITLKR